MQFNAFPFDVHVCNFRVQSLEHPASALHFEYEPNTTGISWKTQVPLTLIIRTINSILQRLMTK